MSRKEIIKNLFSDQKPHTCTEITKFFIRKERLTGSVATYLSGSISTILSSLIKEKFLYYAKYKTDRGGHVYLKVS